MEKFVSVDSTTYMWVTLRKSNTNILEFYLICFKIRYRSNNHKKDLRSLVKSKSESLWFILLYCFLDRQLTEASAINKKKIALNFLVCWLFYVFILTPSIWRRLRDRDMWSGVGFWLWYLYNIFPLYIFCMYNGLHICIY